MTANVYYFLSPFQIANADAFQQLKTDWGKDDYYNFDDLNRVEYFTKKVKDKILFFYGISGVLDENIFVGRDIKTIEYSDSLNRLESNIKQLGTELKTPTGFIAPKVNWRRNDSFSFIDANRLELNLKILLDYIDGQINALQYCGQITCGEGVI